MRCCGDWLTKSATQTVFSMLNGGGFQAFAVGGCVRNTLLGWPVDDVDFATNAHPNVVMALAEQHHLRAIPTGIEHGTITVVVDGEAFEITTFRKDVETDGRRAVVRFADSIATDAHRRDFTVNAIYCDWQGEISDPVNGTADIKSRTIRFIDDAGTRIREDYLRILRYFRFQAWFGDPAHGFDIDILASIADEIDGLDILSAERVTGEVRKLLTAADPAPSVAVMEKCGVLARIIPGASAMSLAAVVHFEEITGVQPRWIRRLAAMNAHDNHSNLRLSRAERRYLRRLCATLSTTQSPDELSYRYGVDAAFDAIVLRSGMLMTPLPARLNERIEFAAKQVFPLRGGDITTGQTGPALGARLAELESRWIASDFNLSKRDLLG